MNNRSALNIVGMLLIYISFAAILLVLQSWAFTDTFDVQKPEDFLDLFRANAEIILGVGFGCILLWFVVGEWMISAWAPARTWYLVWAVLLVTVIGTSVWESFQGPKGDGSDNTFYTVLTYYLLFGILPFYLASMLFSPTNAKYLIWPAKSVRKW